MALAVFFAVCGAVGAELDSTVLAGFADNTRWMQQTAGATKTDAIEHTSDADMDTSSKADVLRRLSAREQEVTELLSSLAARDAELQDLKSTVTELQTAIAACEAEVHEFRNKEDQIVARSKGGSSMKDRVSGAARA